MNTPIIEETIDLNKRFILGPEQYNLTFEEVNYNWKYCGGDNCLLYTSDAADE